MKSPMRSVAVREDTYRRLIEHLERMQPRPSIVAALDTAIDQWISPRNGQRQGKSPYGTDR